jgi:hypothetical protein
VAADLQLLRPDLRCGRAGGSVELRIGAARERLRVGDQPRRDVDAQVLGDPGRLTLGVRREGELHDARVGMLARVVGVVGLVLHARAVDRAVEARDLVGLRRRARERPERGQRCEAQPDGSQCLHLAPPLLRQLRARSETRLYVNRTHARRGSCGNAAALALRWCAGALLGGAHVVRGRVAWENGGIEGGPGSGVRLARGRKTSRSRRTSRGARRFARRSRITSSDRPRACWDRRFAPSRTENVAFRAPRHRRATFYS